MNIYFLFLSFFFILVLSVSIDHFEMYTHNCFEQENFRGFRYLKILLYWSAKCSLFSLLVSFAGHIVVVYWCYWFRLLILLVPPACPISVICSSYWCGSLVLLVPPACLISVICSTYWCGSLVLLVPLACLICVIYSTNWCRSLVLLVQLVCLISGICSPYCCHLLVILMSIHYPAGTTCLSYWGRCTSTWCALFVLKVFVSLASIALITLFLCLTGGYHTGGVMDNMLASILIG